MGVRSRERFNFSPSVCKSPEELQAQWEMYHSTMDPVLKLRRRNELLEVNLPLVERAVWYVWKQEKESPRNSDVHDLFCETVRLLLSTGTLDKFDPTLGVSFVVFFGAISVLRARDSMRKLRQGSRFLRERRRRVNAGSVRLLSQLGWEPALEEVLEEVGVSKAGWEAVCHNWAINNPIRLDQHRFVDRNRGESFEDLSAEDPFLSAHRESLKKAVLSSLERNSRLRSVVLLHYYQDMNFKDIGDLLGISDSRVSQLCAEAVQVLKLKFRNRVDEFVLC